MAIVYMNGFENAVRFTAAGDIGVQTTGGIHNNYIDINSGPNAANYITNTAGADDTWIVGFNFRTNSLAQTGATDDNFLVMFGGDVSTTQHLIIGINADGSFVARRDIATVLGTSATGLILENEWNFIEVKATLHDTTGAVEVRLNSVPVLTLTNQDTKNGGTSANFDTIFFARDGGANTNDYDDMYICNALGTTNNNYLGPVQVASLHPTGTGNYSQFTGQDADSTDNYLNVDETGATSDGDNTYNEADVEGEKDSYTYGDLPAGTWDVFGVQLVSSVRVNAPGTKFFRSFVRSSTTDFPSTSHQLTESFINWVDIYDINPATTAAWLEAEVDAIEAGIEVRDS